MNLSKIALRIQLTADATPTLGGVSGPVPMGYRHLVNYLPADFTGELVMWGLDIANITAGNTPAVSLVDGSVTADGATVTGPVGQNFEGKQFDLSKIVAIVIEVSGAIVTATNADPVGLARLAPGVHAFSSDDGLAEWLDTITFAAVSGTGAISFVILGEEAAA